MRIIGAIFAIVTASSPALSTEEVVGFWESDEGWQTELIEANGGSFCRTSSKLRTVFGTQYSFELTFGDRNSAALLTNRDLEPQTQAAVNFNDGSGYDLYDLKFERTRQTWFRAENSLSGPMLAKLVTSLRNYRQAQFDVGDMSFPIDLAKFETAYSDMRKCERYKAGFVLPD